MFLIPSSTWRSLLPKLEDNPLAFCDYRSVDRSDLVACDRVYPEYSREVYYLHYSNIHKWYEKEVSSTVF